jgi:hypothetical protein
MDILQFTVWSMPGINWPQRRPIQGMENAGCVGVKIVRARVPLRANPSSDRLCDRSERRAHRPHVLSGAMRRTFPRKHMRMIWLKKPAAAAAGQG